MLTDGVVLVGLGAGCAGLRTELKGRDVGRAICDIKTADNADDAQRALDKANRKIEDAQRITGRPINQDVRDSLLDIEAAAKLVEATHSNVELANEALSEAQQRFHAGVSDNLPVSQAQSQTEQANDQYISALYQHNVAKLALARALGVAQTNYKDYLGGK